MNKRRDSFIEFFHYNFVNIKNNILPFLGLAVSAFNSKNDYVFFVRLGFYLLIAGIIIYSFLNWYFKTFEIKDEKIMISEGIFRKRKNDISFNRIKSINTSDSVIKRMFKISNLNIELIGGKKVAFVISNDEIVRLKKEIMNDFEQSENEVKDKKISLFEYILLMLSKPIYFLGTASIVLPIVSFFINKMIDDKQEVEPIDIFTGSAFDSEGSFKMDQLLTLETLQSILLIIIPILILSIAYVYLIYAKFNISNNEKEIKIQYGILSKKNYHIPKKQIRSLRIIEPYLFRKFGYVQLKVDNIGLNENHSSSVLLYPIIKKNKINNILEEYLPLFTLQSVQYTPKKDALFFYILERTYKLFIISFALSFFIGWYSTILLVLVVVRIIYAYINWKYSGLDFNDNFITVRKGVHTTILTLITLKKYTETTSAKQTLFMERTNQHHFNFAVYSEKLTETYGCKYLDDINKNEFLNYLK